MTVLEQAAYLAGQRDMRERITKRLRRLRNQAPPWHRDDPRLGIVLSEAVATAKLTRARRA